MGTRIQHLQMLLVALPLVTHLGDRCELPSAELGRGCSRCSEMVSWACPGSQPLFVSKQARPCSCSCRNPRQSPLGSQCGTERNHGTLQRASCIAAGTDPAPHRNRAAFSLSASFAEQEPPQSSPCYPPASGGGFLSHEGNGSAALPLPGCRAGKRQRSLWLRLCWDGGFVLLPGGCAMPLLTVASHPGAAGTVVPPRSPTPGGDGSTGMLPGTSQHAALATAEMGGGTWGPQ